MSPPPAHRCSPDGSPNNNGPRAARGAGGGGRAEAGGEGYASVTPTQNTPSFKNWQIKPKTVCLSSSQHTFREFEKRNMKSRHIDSFPRDVNHFVKTVLFMTPPFMAANGPLCKQNIMAPFEDAFNVVSETWRSEIPPPSNCIVKKTPKSRNPISRRGESGFKTPGRAVAQFEPRFSRCHGSNQGMFPKLANKTWKVRLNLKCGVKAAGKINASDLREKR